MPLKVDELVSYRLLSEGEKDLSAFELVDEWDIRGADSISARIRKTNILAKGRIPYPPAYGIRQTGGN